MKNKLFVAKKDNFSLDDIGFSGIVIKVKNLEFGKIYPGHFLHGKWWVVDESGCYVLVDEELFNEV